MISSQDGTEARRPRWPAFLPRPRAGGSAGCSAAAGLGWRSGWLWGWPWGSAAGSLRWAAGAAEGAGLDGLADRCGGAGRGGADGAGRCAEADRGEADGACVPAEAAGGRTAGGRGGIGALGPPWDAAWAATRAGSGTLSSAGSPGGSGIEPGAAADAEPGTDRWGGNGCRSGRGRIGVTVAAVSEPGAGGGSSVSGSESRDRKSVV